ncbi:MULTISPECIES: Na/Pi cotransporter family protein [unclassified Aureimonas]|uniref:Na/Pi cotransporter family protein n=1 Tax=unclassified Aureimonas TaxID=2615206 RepID=UPI0007020515|nr:MULTISPECIES: Na/Pi cotransporter family protein [unclassified Aureimonas]KQT57499.1 Na/Pi cotransporter [Aureimonas sp. Leaf427]KQT77179.1 Na/Pi cotransporter [Aureimonas sp. Leaf460]
MSATEVLVGLAGQIALLLWGLHMVTSGVQRALGSRLAGVVRMGLGNRAKAALTGFGMTALLQSSTATAMMVSAFAAGGVVDLMPALSVMLGANIGTTLIVQLVSFDLSMLSPGLILVGVLAYRSGGRPVLRDIGSALVGLGLMLLALRLLTATMAPLEASADLRAVLHILGSDPLLNVLMAAILAWAAHSSVAAILFVMSLAGAGVVAPEAALAMVLGANIGSALNPVIAHLGGDPVHLRLPIGNLVNRLIGAALAIAFVEPASVLLLSFDDSPARAAAGFHMLFNIATGLLFLPLLRPMTKLLKRLLPAAAAASDPGAPRYLDSAALTTPSVALSNAAREVLRMADVIDTMLRRSQEAFRHDDPEKIAATSRLDDVLDRLFQSIQLYLGAIGQEELEPAEQRKLSDTLTLAINLEHMGDIIDRNLMDVAARRIRHGLRLSEEAGRQIEDMHTRLIDHLQLAVAAFMFGDRQAAQRLVLEKEAFREIERATQERHFARMRQGTGAEIDASSLQLDIVRDLKRIEAHIAATGHSLLELSGQLRPSRLQPGL